EEEGGGTVLRRYLGEHGATLDTDCLLIWDGGFDFDGSAVLTTGLRGILYTEIHARGARADLHSGVFGGAAPNAANTLAHVLAALKDRDGRVTIPGFYDDVREATPQELEEWSSWPQLEGALNFAVGARALEGEAGRSLAERVQTRPTLDVNGIWGGFTDAGEKTVIPAEATAKVSMRLVPDQEPDRIFEALAAYAPTLSTPGVEIEVRRLSAGAPPVVLGSDSAAMRAARQALETAFETTSRLTRAGYSIPVVIDFQRHVDAPIVSSGFAQFDCNVHSPDENLVLDHFGRGVEMMIRFFWEYGKEVLWTRS
ncbi:MAG TPA: peptidase dimerization domain-containing protein, partial [Candidatus Dormibacteraeota bacterium]